MCRDSAKVIRATTENETMQRFHLQDASAGFYALTVYGASKRDALNRYRAQWYPQRDRLPRGIAIWNA